MTCSNVCIGVDGEMEAQEELWIVIWLIEKPERKMVWWVEAVNSLGVRGPGAVLPTELDAVGPLELLSWKNYW